MCSNNVCGGMCFDSTSSNNALATNWSYIGQGRGGYEKMKHYDFVGHGRGSFEKTQVTQLYDWRCRKGCIGLAVAIPLLLTAIVLLCLLPALGHRHAVEQATAAMEDRYVLTRSYVGEDFFSKWGFWTSPDPSNGAVEYVSYETAVAEGLAQASHDSVVLKANLDPLVLGMGRRSVRIQSNDVYNSGLFITRIDHVPTGCGTWPAFWMYGEDVNHAWPAWGEYDVIEAIHRRTDVMTSIHTGLGCEQSSVYEGRDFAGRWGRGQTGDAADDCIINAPDQWENQGCSQHGPVGSMGAGFNTRGGGTFAAEWDPVAKHIRTWFWPAGSEPADVTGQQPDPNNWGKPYSFFSLAPEVCDKGHFVNMRLVFTLNFCGDLGASKFAEECPELARTMTCEVFITRHPELLQDAFWSIRVLDVYNRANQGTGHSTGQASHGEVHRSSSGVLKGLVICLAVVLFFAAVIIGALSIVHLGFPPDGPDCRRIGAPPTPGSPVATQTVSPNNAGYSNAGF